MLLFASHPTVAHFHRLEISAYDERYKGACSTIVGFRITDTLSFFLDFVIL